MLKKLKRGIALLMAPVLLAGCFETLPVRAEETGTEVADETYEVYESTGDETPGSEDTDIICEEAEGATAPATSFAGGTGTKENPYLISNYAELLRIGLQTDEYLHYKLTADINANTTAPGENSENVWTPVEGKYCYLDGNGHTINNLCLGSLVTNPGQYESYQTGLFARTYEQKAPTEIKNLTVNNVYFKYTGSNPKGYTYGGTLADYVDYLSNCCVKGTITFPCKGYLGGLAYRVSMKAENCTYDAGLESDGYELKVAGIVYSASNIVDCKTTASAYIRVGGDSNGIGAVSGIVNTVDAPCDVHGNVNNAVLRGGTEKEPRLFVSGIAITLASLSAYASDKGFYSNVNNAALSGSQVSGIVSSSHALVSDCENKGALKALRMAFGISYDSDADIKNCVNRGNITVTGDNTSTAASAAGISNNIWYANMENCTNYGNISVSNVKGAYEAAGVLISTYGNVKNCINHGNVTTEYWSSGIVHSIMSDDAAVELSDCINYGTITGNTSAGIVFSVTHVTCSRCCNAGNLKGVTRSSDDTKISQVAGLATMSFGSTYEDCYNRGSMDSGDAKAGNASGLIGTSYGDTVRRCYNIGKITSGISNKYGIADYETNSDEGTSKFEKCYYCNDKELKGAVGDYNGSILTQADATALSLDDMKKASSFAGFDFTDTWKMGSTDKYKYPVLKGEDESLINPITEPEPANPEDPDNPENPDEQEEEEEEKKDAADPLKTPVTVKESRSGTVGNGNVTVDVNVQYPQAVVWTGKQITKAQLSVLQQNSGADIAAATISGLDKAIEGFNTSVDPAALVKISYKISKEKSVSTHKASFTVKLTANAKNMKKAGIKGDNKKAFKALLGEMNDKLAARPYYFDIVPIDLGAAEVTVKAKLKNGQLQLNEDKSIKGLKSVKVKATIPGLTKPKTFTYTAKKAKKLFTLSVQNQEQKLVDLSALNDSGYKGTKKSITVGK